MDGQVGLQVGNYRLVRLLGAGGFAKVYLGEHIYLRTPAAIKLLQVRLTYEAMNTFLKEARIIAVLDHPHIVRLLDFGVEKYFPFLVMNYAPYGSLRLHIQRQNLHAPQDIFPYIKQAASALYYAHQRKIIHRDVKPDNMLLSANGTVLLSDFGLAVESRSSGSMRTGDRAGTTIYMAPEQLQGKPCPASDQYALGIVVYEWLCGVLPFNGSDIGVAAQHLHDPPPPLRQHVPTLPPALEEVVMRALEKDPAHRFATVQDFATSFEKASMQCVDRNDQYLEPPLLSDQALGQDSSSLSQPLQASVYSTQSLDAEETSALPGGLKQEQDTMPEALPPATSLFVDRPVANSPTSALPSSEPAQSAPPTPGNQGHHTPSVLPDTKRSQPQSPFSRRKMLLGGVGVGAVLCGAGIWYMSSMRGTGLPAPARLSPVTSFGTATERAHDTGSAKAANPAIPSKSSTDTASTYSTSTSATPASATSTSTTPTSANSQTNMTSVTPAAPSGTMPVGSSATSVTSSAAPTVSSATPTATSVPAQTSQVTVRVSSVPDPVHNGTTVNVSITTNPGGISIQLVVTYSSWQKGFTSAQQATDGNGQATVSWSISIPPGHLKDAATATLVAVANDQKGGQVTSSPLQVQVLP